MKRLWILGVCGVAAAAIVVGCGGSSNSGGGTTAGSTTAGASTAGGTTSGGIVPATATIDAINNSAAPMGFSFDSPITVKSGTSVTWVNQSRAPHGITWDAQAPSTSPAPGANIPVFGAGTTSAPFVAPTVTTSTTYNYHCTIHGPTMSGQIIVTP